MPNNSDQPNFFVRTPEEQKLNVTELQAPRYVEEQHKKNSAAEEAQNIQGPML